MVEATESVMPKKTFATSVTALVVLPRMSGRFVFGVERSLVEGEIACESTGSDRLAAEALDHSVASVTKTAKAAMMAMSHAMRFPPTVWVISLLNRLVLLL